ncbi:MAG: glycosyltransferase family 4 protein [Candidatus Omnitrophica bacterium]|nr:glycosyltransferase family 4 protein [Candidatus Omnitrophota bacterium]
MDKNKRILIVMDYYMKRLDSMAEFHRMFLQECVKRDVIAEFVLPIEPCELVKTKLKDVGFKYTVLNNWWADKFDKRKHNIWIAFSIANLIKSKKIDLATFHFCFESTIFVIKMLNALMLCLPKLIWYQHSEIHNASGSFLLKTLKKYISKIGLLSHVVDKICAVSKEVKKQLIAKGVSESKIMVIYNGVNLDKFQSKKTMAEIFPNLNIVNRLFFITTVSMLIPAKGLEYLIRAIPMVTKYAPEVMFIVVGEGYFQKNLTELVDELGVQENIYFTGRRSDVPEILCASDFLVHPSLKEALPYTILEVMAAGKAVVASAVGGIPELVKHGTNGVLVPAGDHVALGDAIKSLLNSKNLSLEMGVLGRRMIEEKFAIGKVINQHLQLYEIL